MSELKFDISSSNEDLIFSSHTRVDEEGLLPGINQSRAATGFLIPPHMVDSHIPFIQFASIEEQHPLNTHNLTSHGSPLHYELSQQNQLLTATSTTDLGKMVFTVELHQTGAYTFTLHDHLDRPSLPNLLHYEEGKLTWESVTPQSGVIHLMQAIDTQPHVPYKLSFEFSSENNLTAFRQIHAYWDDHLLCIINPHESGNRGYTFLIEGNLDASTTLLKFIAIGSEELHKNFLKEVSVINTSQQHLPLEFIYQKQDGDQTNHESFLVNVTTTPSIQLNNHVPSEVIFEDVLYQTIVVNGETVNTNPLTTLNLETLFNSLAIAPENRQVNVVQLEENGQPTSVYEVQIFDKTESLPPITVADVMLSFPGGDGGVEVFQKTVAIEEGNHPWLLPPIDFLG